MRLQVQNIETKMKVMHRRVILKWLLTWHCSALAVSKSRPVSRMHPVQESNLACGVIWGRTVSRLTKTHLFITFNRKTIIFVLLLCNCFPLIYCWLCIYRRTFQIEAFASELIIHSTKWEENQHRQVWRKILCI